MLGPKQPKIAFNPKRDDDQSNFATLDKHGIHVYSYNESQIDPIGAYRYKDRWENKRHTCQLSDTSRFSKIFLKNFVHNFANRPILTVFLC